MTGSFLLPTCHDNSQSSIDRLAGAESRRPGPLEIMTAEMAGHIDYLADKEQPRYSAALHRFCGSFTPVNTAGSHLGFFIAFGSVWQNSPAMNLALHFVESGIGPPLGRMQFEPTLRQSNGQRGVQCGCRRRKIAAHAVLPQHSSDLQPGSQVNCEPLRTLPIGGDLQDGGPAQAAMGNQQFLAKMLTPGRCDHLCRNSCQIAVALLVFCIEGEGNQGRPAFANLDT